MANTLVKRGMVLLLVLLMFVGAGCSLINKDKPPTADTKAKQGEQSQNKDSDKDKNKDKDSKSKPAASEAKDDDEPDVAVMIQQENPLLGPAEHQQRVEAISNVITDFLENMKTNQTAQAQLYLYGVEHKGNPITMGQLQQEIEALHPVSWHLDSCKPVEQNNALVTITVTWPDDTQRQMQPFNMQLAEDNNWYIHFNSFATSFHDIARPLMKDQKK